MRGIGENEDWKENGRDEETEWKIRVGMERIEGEMRRIGKENGRDWRGKKGNIKKEMTIDLEGMGKRDGKEKQMEWKEWNGRNWRGSGMD